MAEKSEPKGTTALFLIRGILIFVLNLVLYSIVLFAAVHACSATYSFANEVFGDVIAEAPPGQEKSFVVAESDDLFTISKNLEEQGLVANAYSFYIRLKLSMGEKSIVQSKTSQLNTSMTYNEILDEIVKDVK